MSRRDIPASVRDRLLNKSKVLKRPFLEILQYYAMERLLYRLSISPYANRFFLKGALMFRAWHTSSPRPTMDIDLLGKTENSVKNLENIFSEICQQNDCQDGISFYANTVKGSIIQTEAEYEGVRIEFEGDLNKAIVHMQIDIGFGDIISPAPQILPYPTLLDYPPPTLQAYTRESVIAEKLEAMIKRGLLNSRMKDFFDIWTLAHQFSFKSNQLAHSIKATFDQRGTPLSAFPECFSEVFVTDPLKISQWNSFLQKHRIQHNALSLQEVVAFLVRFLSPVLNPTQETIDVTWHPPDKWI